jgi:hypothetical protein
MKNLKPEELAEEIERNLKLEKPNQAIYFNDVEWATICKALRVYAKTLESE